ncbi:MAG TPA: adenosyl-hopene transferase HpnH [Blastocatellia bacterium]
MPVPIRQAVKVGSYVFKKRIKGEKQYPLVLMLEPLFRCNLACAGCGKIQYPSEILRKHLSPEACFQAVDECKAPMVTIAGGEPLMHPQIDAIARGLIDRKKFVYLCTNGILLEKHMHRFQPSPYFSFSVHVDGLEKRHDELVCRDGIFETAVNAIKAAKALGFRVTTNTTVFDGESPDELHDLFDFLSDLGVDGMMVSPGYSYAWAPDQEHFLKREQTKALFREVLAPISSKRGKRWKFNHSPFYLKFLMGDRDYDCTPWGMPSYSLLGWQKPCYLLNEGYAKTFKELLDTTDWGNYGYRSGNPKCADCMVHCGFEQTAVMDSTSSLKNIMVSARAVR